MSTRSIRPWTEDEIEYLKANALEVSYNIIAKKLGRTREMVCAKANRLGIDKRGQDRRSASSNLPGAPNRAISLRQSRGPAKPRAPRARPEKPARELSPVQKILAQKKVSGQGAGSDSSSTPLPPQTDTVLTHGVHPEDAHIVRRPLRDLEHNECRWPIGDPQHPDFGMCGAKSVAGLPYCEAHVRRAFRPIEPRTRAVTKGSPSVVDPGLRERPDIETVT